MGKTAIYIRLSSEDTDARMGNKDESNSVAHQRMMLMDYAGTQLNLRSEDIVEFVDDGYTGRNFDRPGFEALLDACKKEQVTQILLKDLSRLGRNYVEVGNLLEQVFPFLGVRVISVNDGYDSDNYNGVTGGMDITLQNFIYTLYSRDLSEKVKSGVRMLAKKGKYTGTYGFFGYRKCADDIHKLEPDPDAAKIVRRIFDMVIAGTKRKDIAATLNREGVPTPAVYKKMKGCTRDWYPDGKKAGWNSSMIADVIRDERYAGHMVSHKTAYVGNEGKKQVILPKDQWIIVRNTHEGIVSDEEFAEANGKMKKFSKAREYKGVDKGAFSVFVCPYCGLRLHAPSTNNKLFCSTGRIRPDTPCAEVSIDRTLAEETILTLVRKQAEVMITAADALKRKKEENGTSLQKLLKEEQQLQRQKLALKNQQISLYESYREGKFDKTEFIGRKSEIKAKTDKTEAKLDEVIKQIDTAKSDEEETLQLPITNYAALDIYDKRIIASLIEKAEVLGDDTLHVIWKHQDEYDRVLDLIS